MEPAAPDLAAHLRTIADAIAARAEEAGRRLDALTATLDELLARVDGDGARPSRPSLPDPAVPIRLVAIELAVSGRNRAETESRLRESFPDAGLDAVLDDVFGDNRV